MVTLIFNEWWNTYCMIARSYGYKNWISLFVRSLTVSGREEHSLSSRALCILHSFFIHSLILMPLLAQLHSCSQSIEIEIFKDRPFSGREHSGRWTGRFWSVRPDSPLIKECPHLIYTRNFPAFPRKRGLTDRLREARTLPSSSFPPIFSVAVRKAAVTNSGGRLHPLCGSRWSISRQSLRPGGKKYIYINTSGLITV